MTTSTVEKLVWILIYGGLLVLSLSFFVARGDAAVGWVLGVIGAAAALAGVVLIWWRSRMTSPAPSPAPPTRRGS
jgi:O-antigen/teichoic acid export membrane protein